MDIIVNNIEARVLGSLVEKEITTPDYYPLSLNALINACNQKSNRDPAMHLDEGAVRQALQGLAEIGVAGPARGADSRVIKYEHRLSEVFNFHRNETAVLCELLLRGPQTPGELRSRAERMHPFSDLGEVQSTLQLLMKREPPLVTMLARQPGTKEARYAHLLSGDLESWHLEPASDEAAAPNSGNRSGDGAGIARLEGEIAILQKEIAELKEQVNDLRRRL